MTHQPIPPSWRRPPGVALGTWQYVHQRSIARHYDDFVADTPLCQLDQGYVLRHLKKQSQENNVRKPTENSSTRSRLVVADFGCGTGRLALPLAELGLDVVAIDLSQSMLEQLREKARGSDASLLGDTFTDLVCAKKTVIETSHGEPQNRLPIDSGTSQSGAVMPVRANLVELSGFCDQSVDHAICMFSTLGMIQGRDNRRSFLSSAYRMVKPGGTFVIHVHRRWAALAERGGMLQLINSAWRSVVRSDHEFGDSVYAYRGLENMFMHRFSRRELNDDFRASGWRVCKMDLVGQTGNGLTKSALRSSGFLMVCTK